MHAGACARKQPPTKPHSVIWSSSVWAIKRYDARSVLRRLGPTIEAAPGVARRTVVQPDLPPQEAQQ